MARRRRGTRTARQLGYSGVAPTTREIVARYQRSNPSRQLRASDDRLLVERHHQSRGNPVGRASRLRQRRGLSLYGTAGRPGYQTGRSRYGHVGRRELVDTPRYAAKKRTRDDRRSAQRVKVGVSRTRRGTLRRKITDLPRRSGRWDPRRHRRDRFGRFAKMGGKVR